MLKVLMKPIIIISLFKVYFTITFHNYKELINVNLSIKLDTNSMTNNLELYNVSKLISGLYWGKKITNHF